MKFTLKPVTLIRRPGTPALAAVVSKPPTMQTVSTSYEHLVTSHGVPPEKAKALLGVT